jgi:hypothetical protein
MLRRLPVRMSVWAAIFCALGLAAGGCDTQQRMADHAAEAQMQKVEIARQQAATLDQLQDVERQYDSLASQIVTLSPRMHILIRGNQASVRYEVAMLQLAQLRSEEQAITRTIDEIENLAVQVAAAQTSVTGLQAYDPSQQIDAIRAKETAIQGSAGDNTSGTNSSLASVSAQIDKLNDQINQATAQKQTLQQQRTDSLNQADTLTRKAEGETADQALQDTVSASDQRRIAGETDANINALTVQIGRLQTDLASAQAQKTALEAAVASLDSQIQTIQTGWTSIQQQIDAQKALQQQIIGTDAAAQDTSDPNQTVTIALLASRLNSMLTDAGTLRDDLTARLEQVVSQFGDAASAAGSLRGQLLPETEGLKPTPDAIIYRDMLATLNPTFFNLQKAAAMQDQASVAASNVAIQFLQARMFNGYQVISGSQTVNVAGLSALLDHDKTGIDVPQAIANLPHPDPDTLKQLQQDVNDKFTNALDQYNVHSGVDSGQLARDETNLALMGRVVTNHKWAQYATLIGDNDGASQHLRDADSDDSQIDPAYRTAGQPAPPAPASGTDNTGGTSNPNQ